MLRGGPRDPGTGQAKRLVAPARIPLPALLRERGTDPRCWDAIALRLIDKTTETLATATYGQLWRRSAWVAGELEQVGVEPGDPVMLLMESRLEFYYALFGAMLLGALPVAVYPPASQQNLVPALEHLSKVLHSLKARAIVASRALIGVAGQVRIPGCSVVMLEQTQEAERAAFVGERAPLEEPVLLQYTSGSLSEPKAIELCTRSIHANLSQIGDAFGMCEGDVGLSWLPLYHDMGLHSVFFSLMFQMPLVVMSPLEFLRRPVAWLQAASRYGATHSPAPSFGYAYAARRIRDEDLATVDLSRWRVAMCGAEAIDSDALFRFADRFAAVGFQRSALMGAYGLAENTVAVSFARWGSGLRVDRVDAEALASRGIAEPASSGRAVAIASVGPPIASHHVRIVDQAGNEVAEATQGQIEVQGESRMLRYRGDPLATREAFDGEWLRTGDLGYARAGELYVTGRIKDLIIRGGKNYYPQDLESAAGAVDGIRAGSVAAFGLHDPTKGTEEILVVAEVKRAELLLRAELSDSVRKAILEATGLAVNRVQLVAPGVVPKTTSGKIRRGETRLRYQSGRLTLPPRPGIALLTRIGAFNVLAAWLDRTWGRFRRALFG